MNTNIINMRKPEEFEDQIYAVTGCAMTVLNTLGHGFSEKVYENSLAVELQTKKIDFVKQPAIEVFYDSINVGTYMPDFIVNDEIIVELKTIQAIGNSEYGQVLNYLKATGKKLGLILNFKKPKLEWKRITLE